MFYKGHLKHSLMILYMIIMGNGLLDGVLLAVMEIGTTVLSHAIKRHSDMQGTEQPKN